MSSDDQLQQDDRQEKREEDEMKASPDCHCPEPVFFNFVATVSLGIDIDLRRVYQQVRPAEYNPSSFSGLILRLIAPRAVTMLFHTGNLIVTGVKTEDESRLAARTFVRLMQRIPGGYPNAKFLGYKIQNVVAKANVKFPINVEAISVAHCNFSTYEPELFPALIYRLVNPHVTLLIFVSGWIVLTGGKSREEVRAALQQMYPVFQQFRIETRAEQEAKRSQAEERDDGDPPPTPTTDDWDSDEEKDNGDPPPTPTTDDGDSNEESDF